MAVKHSFASTIADGADNTLVQPSDWNAEHVWSGLTAGQILYPDSATTVTGSVNLTWGTAAGQGLTLAAGIATTDVKALSITQTWNNAAVTFTGHKFTITDTASAAGSLALQILGGAAGTTNLFSVSKNGQIFAPDGSGGAPSYSFSTKATVGFNYLGGDGIGIPLGNGGGARIALMAIGGMNSFVSNDAGGFGWANAVNIISNSSLDTALSRISAGVVGVGTGTTGSFAGSLKLTNITEVGYHEMTEMTAPAGAADNARIFAQDNGAGKTRLMVIFGTGAAQQIAIEP